MSWTKIGKGGSSGGGIAPTPPSIQSKAILAEDTNAGVLVYYTNADQVGGVSTVGIANASVAGKFPCIGATVAGGLAGETVDIVHQGDLTTDTSFFNVGQIVSLGNNGFFFAEPEGIDQRVGVVKVKGNTGIVFLNIDMNENPNIPVLQDGEMLHYDTANGYQGTGDINTATMVDFGAKDLKCKTVITESSSVEVGPGVTLSDRGGFLQNRSSVTGRDFISVDYQVDETGTQKPLYESRAAEVVRDVVQADDSQTMVGVTSYQVVPTKSQDINRVYIKLVNPIDNFRVEVVSDVTGEVVKYIPTRNDFENGTGLTFAAGEQFFDLISPLAELVGFPLTVNVAADQSIDVLGDGTNPWRAVDSQDITPYQMLDETDIAPEMASSSVIRLDGLPTQASATTVDVPAGEWRHVTFDAQGVKTEAVIPWVEQLGVTVPNIGTAVAQKLVIDVNGDAVFIDEISTDITNRDFANLAVVSHPGGAITSVVANVYKGQEVYSQFLDNLDTMGVTRKSGLAVNLNANLTFDRTAGILQGAGAGVADGQRGQNLAPFVASSPATFGRILGTTNSIENPAATVIDPGFWDNGSGTKVAIPAPTQQATIVHIYQAIAGTTGIAVLYGQTLYPTLNDAVLNAPTDIPDLPEVLQANANLIERIAVISNATNLLDPAQAQALGGVKFGTGLGGSGFGNVSGGGDMFGAASSTTDEAVTFADNGGKVAKSGSDMSMVAGVVKRILSTGNAEFQSGNGISKLQVTPTTINMVAKNAADNSTTTWTLVDSNGAQFGGSSLNVNSASGSIGYKASQNGNFKNQIYWNSVEDLTHVSHKGTNSNPNADLIFDDTEITTEFSSTKAMSIDNNGHLQVTGATPEVVLQEGGTPRFTWDSNSGTMRLGVTGFASTSAYLNFESGFASVNGGSAGWSRLVSGTQRVIADNSNSRVMIESTAADGQITLETGGTESIDINSTTGNINIADGADGNANFFFGRIRLSNPSDEADFQLADSADDAVGGTRYDSTKGAVEVYNGTNATTDNSIFIADTHTETINKFVAFSDEEPEGYVQSGAKVSGTGFTKDIGAPFVANSKINNGGDTPADFLPMMTWSRVGIPNQSYSNDVSWEIGRFQAAGDNARTGVDLRMSDGLNDGDGAPIVMEYRSSGRHAMGGRVGGLDLYSNNNEPTISFQNGSRAELGGLTYDNGKFGTVLYKGAIGSATNAFTLTDDYSNTGKKLIVNSAEAARAHLQVGDQFSDPGNFTEDLDAPAFINLLDTNGGNTLAAPKSALILGRSGVSSEAYGNLARFDLSRYENADTQSRTQMDIRLSHRQLTTAQEANNTPVIMSMKSNGEVLMPSTTAAFFPPVVTTAQMNAITPAAGATAFNSEIGAPVYGNGTQWNAVSATVSVLGRVIVQNGIALNGVFQTINTGTFAFFDINGLPATPDFTNGVWVCPANGTYQVNVSGWAFTGSGSETQSRFYVSINGLDYTDLLYAGVDQVTKNGGGLTVNGICRINAGDTVQIGYSVLSGTGWQLDNFRWDVARVGN